MDTDQGPFSVADVKPYAVPARLDDLQGPDHGVVTLPRDVAWSGRRQYDLDDDYDRAAMYTVTVTRRTSDLVQMMASGPDGEMCKVDLGIFWRAREPVVLAVGPVLHPDDAAAGKMDALFNRWAPRDFLDIYAIHLSGRYDRRQLEALLMEHNPGFDRAMFAESLGFLARIPDREFAAYGVDKKHVAAMRAHFAKWQDELR